MGVAVQVQGSPSSGSRNIWSDVTLTPPPGGISVLRGPSGTGISVFLESLAGLPEPDCGLDPHQRHRHRPARRVPAVDGSGQSCTQPVQVQPVQVDDWKVSEATMLTTS